MSNNGSIPRVNPGLLRNGLSTCFNESELRDLCFDLGVDYENLPGEGKGDKARELIAYFGRRGCVSKLIVEFVNRRPLFTWEKKREAVQNLLK